MEALPFITLAFGFGNLAILGWLAAAAAPLLIHLWSRRRYREVPWAAIEFLRAAMRKNARRLQLQQWLLIAVRTLLILAVVAALAEPFGNQSAAGIGGAAPTHRVFVLDCSFSMGYRNGENTLFARAQNLAIQKIKASGVSDGFSIIAMGAPPEVIIREPSLDSAAAIKAVADIKLSEGGGNLQATLELVREVLASSGGGPAPFARQEVCFLTDLGMYSWQSAQNNSDDGAKPTPIQQLLEQVGDLASIVVLDIGTPDAENLAVVGLTSELPVATTAAEVSFTGRLANFGSQAKEGVQVTLQIDGQPQAKQAVDIPAGGEVSVRFSHRLKIPGDLAVSLQLEGDQLEVDNTRWLVASVKEQIRVLCVAGKHREAIHVARALDPDPNNSASPSALSATVITDGQLRDTNLDQYDCVVLCNVAQVTANEAAQLRQYLRGGGGLIVFLGDRVLAGQYNQNLAADGSTPGLIPARLLEPANTTQFGIDPLGYRHPIVQPFRGRERAGLLTTPVSRYFRLQMSDELPNIETVIALANGDPLVVAAPVENGLALLVATAGSLVSMDPATGQTWSSMAAWPSFLPIVREMVIYSMAGNESVSTALVGEPLSGRLTGARQESVQLVRPDERTESINKTGLENRDWVYDATDISGIYRLSVGEVSPQLLAVNLDPMESNLDRVDVDLLPPQLVIHTSDAMDQQSIDSATSPPQQGPLAGNLLMIALGLAMLEVGLAWMMGGGRQ